MTSTHPDLQIVFSIDMTCSMRCCMSRVREKVEDLLKRLHNDLPAVTTAVVAVGDYFWGYEGLGYIIKHRDFTADVDALIHFLKDAGDTPDGASDGEAYEVMLRLVRTDLQWTQDSYKVLVIIGDEYPHRVSDPVNKAEIDWKRETRLLDHMGVRICGVQAVTLNQSENKSTDFFRMITAATGGEHMNLSEIDTLYDVLKDLCCPDKEPECGDSNEADASDAEGPKRRTLSETSDIKASKPRTISASDAKGSKARQPSDASETKGSKRSKAADASDKKGLKRRKAANASDAKPPKRIKAGPIPKTSRPASKKRVTPTRKCTQKQATRPSTATGTDTMPARQSLYKTQAKTVARPNRLHRHKVSDTIFPVSTSSRRKRK